MTGPDEAEKIYEKLCREGDVTWKESDAIYKITYDHMHRGLLDAETDKRKAFLMKWYNLVLSKVIKMEKGIYLHTILIKSRNRFIPLRKKNPIPEEYSLMNKINQKIAHGFLEDKDLAVILTLKSGKDVRKFLNKKIPLNLAGRKYIKFDYQWDSRYSFYYKEMMTDRYQKYFFEMYRPMTLSRIGFDDYVKLDMNNADFTAACVFYGDKENKEVCRLSHLYEKAIEIMLDMGVPMYAYSITPFNSMLDSLFDMFVHKDYAQEAGMIFNALPYIAKKRHL